MGVRLVGRSAAGIATVLAVTAAAPVGVPLRVRAASTFAGALEPTQLANFIQLVEHTVHFVQMVKRAKQQVESWKQALKKLDPASIAMAVRMAQDVADLVRQYRGVTFAARANIENYKKTHPGEADPVDGNYQKAYADLDRDTMASVERGLQAMDVQLTDPKGGVVAQSKVLEELAEKARTVDGQVQAIAITNELLVQLNQQVQKLHITLTSHAQQMGHHIANEAQARAYDRRTRSRYVEPARPLSAPRDWSRQR